MANDRNTRSEIDTNKSASLDNLHDEVNSFRQENKQLGLNKQVTNESTSAMISILPDGTSLTDFGNGNKSYICRDGTKISEVKDESGNTIQQFSFGISQGPTRIIYKDQRTTLERVNTHDGGRADSWFQDGKIYQTDFYNKKGTKSLIEKHLPNGDIEHTYPDSPGAFKIIHPDGSSMEKIVTNSGTTSRMLDKNGKEVPPMLPAAKASPELGYSTFNEQKLQKPEDQTTLPQIKNEATKAIEAAKAIVDSKALAELRASIVKAAAEVKNTVTSVTKLANIDEFANALEQVSANSRLNERQPINAIADRILDHDLFDFQVNEGKLIVNSKLTDTDLENLVKLSKIKDIKSVTITRDADLSGVTDEGIGLLSQVDNLEELIIDNVSLNDNWLAKISELNNLKTLALSSLSITDDGLTHLKDKHSLQSLTISATNITDAGLINIAKLTNLNTLNLNNNYLSGQGLAQLKDLTKLGALSLNATNITTDGVQHISNFKNLKNLDLGYTLISDESLAHLQVLPNLSQLELHGCTKITDAGLAHLKDLRSLTQLDLNGTDTTNYGLWQLHNLGRLESLNLNHTNITKDGLLYLEQMSDLKTLYFENNILSAKDIEELVLSRVRAN